MAIAGVNTDAVTHSMAVGTATRIGMDTAMVIMAVRESTSDVITPTTGRDLCTSMAMDMILLESALISVPGKRVKTIGRSML